MSSLFLILLKKCCQGIFGLQLLQLKKWVLLSRFSLVAKYKAFRDISYILIKTRRGTPVIIGSHSRSKNTFLPLRISNSVFQKLDRDSCKRNFK